MKLKKFIRDYILYAAFAVALVGMLGSLYFGEVMKLPPCSLCWYQRIALYPLVVILAIGIMWDEKRYHVYAIPFAVTGLLIGLYHNLLYYSIIPATLQPCTLGVSCTTKYYELFGFLSIPMMSLLAFVFVLGSILVHMKLKKEI